ncbi:hypothetical protein L1887_16144 [Cichorium endivia]|nr:hypothetical protein L1887_16144 [Cichorium endivia]
MLSSMLKKMIISNFTFHFKFTGRNKKQPVSSFVNEMDVSKEYLEAFRTKSYMDICDQVQSRIGLDNESSSSLPSIRDHYIHHCNIPEPQKKTMVNLAKTFDIPCLLHDFFNAGLEAWKICEELLNSIHQEHANRHSIQRIVKLTESVPKGDQHTTIYKELALYSSLANPLSDFSLEKFPKIHNHLKLLLKRLTANEARIKRKRRLVMCMKKTVGCALVASYTVLAVALVVLAFHGLVGIVASAGLISYLLGLTKKANAAKKGLKTSELKRVGYLLDMAAKGIYTLIKDFDTIGSLAGRLHNEVEFGKTMARKCVANLKADVLEEVMREFRIKKALGERDDAL